MPRRLSLLAAVVLLVISSTAASALDPIPRRLPPPGIAIPDDVRAELQAGLDKIAARIKDENVGGNDQPDVLIFHKAVDFALRDGEFYAPKDFDTARRLLAAANERLDQLQQGKRPWQTATGRVVRGYRSIVDDSIQPYGLDIPAGFDFSQPAPMIVWLHGRGDKQCDLQFINDRLNKGSEFAPPGVIVLHPFGRQCLGYKSAGETDVLETVFKMQRDYKIDPRRIALMGFSMGGAGTWHLGAHYAHLWCLVAPGAGFAETARYQKLKPENYPPWYEQTLWGQYDCPPYARNLLHVPLVAYSGEIDPQQQAARLMEAALAEHGYKLRHLIGPGTAHAYHPETKQELLKIATQALAAGQPELPKQVSLQTRTLRYYRQHWVEAHGLSEHSRDARVDADLSDDGFVTATTSNVTALRLLPFGTSGKALHVKLDGQQFAVGAAEAGAQPPEFVRVGERWELRSVAPPMNAATLPLAKRPHQQGPIDDAFRDRFLVVTPSEKSSHPAVQAWIEFELNHLRERWRTVFRGELPEKRDSEVTEHDMATCNLILWGEPETNSVLQMVREELPIRWTTEKIVVGGEKDSNAVARTFDRATHVPALIYPNRVRTNVRAQEPHYIVVNSGPTFREADDSTNSRQNPRLPDWAIIDLSQPPNASLPGRIADADFFDEAWQLKPPRK